MHIALVSRWFPPESGWGGVSVYNSTIAHAYAELGHQVTVIAARFSRDVPAERCEDGARVRRLLVGDAYRLRRLPMLGRYVRPAQQLAYSWRVNQAIRRLHQECPVDIVEFAEVNAEGFFYARAPQTPFVVRCHTPTFMLSRYYEQPEMPYDTSIIERCERSLIGHADALTAPSRDMACLISRECHVPAGDIAVIPNPLATDGFCERSGGAAVDGGPNPSDDGSVTVLHVGRFERAKGVMVLVKAIPIILQGAPRTRFVFIGADRARARGSSPRDGLADSADGEPVSSRVQFLGGVEQSALISWYRRADICVVPSLVYESFSYTCAQAMAAGKPVVASRIGGVPETVGDGVSGILVNPGDAEGLAEAVVRLARDADLRRRMGKAGSEKAAREFDPIEIAKRTLRVYERAISDFRRGPQAPGSSGCL
ncbi:MAG: glycosyltransferase family 4 protein [Chloroflexi bacterium]|nr:glycosyltransferase family 4 protein [Chloroflexota bacterium]